MDIPLQKLYLFLSEGGLLDDEWTEVLLTWFMCVDFAYGLAAAEQKHGRYVKKI